jgi:hypothetical protein
MIDWLKGPAAAVARALGSRAPRLALSSSEDLKGKSVHGHGGLYLPMVVWGTCNKMLQRNSLRFATVQPTAPSTAASKGSETNDTPVASATRVGVSHLHRELAISSELLEASQCDPAGVRISKGDWLEAPLIALAVAVGLNPGNAADDGDGKPRQGRDRHVAQARDR